MLVRRGSHRHGEEEAGGAGEGGRSGWRREGEGEGDLAARGEGGVSVGEDGPWAAAKGLKVGYGPAFVFLV
jgi:hypothetical protein